jgi:hypothetical protein
MAVTVMPFGEDSPVTGRAFTATTKEFSNSGVAVVMDHLFAPEEAVIGFRLREAVAWIRARPKHIHPMGGGFFQIGFRLTERLHVGDYPELAKIVF